MKALVVEDDDTSRLILMKFLAPFGEVSAAADGLEALRVLRGAIESKQTFDLVCLDIMLPKVDGQAVLRELRVMEKYSDDPHPPKACVFMVSALNDKDNVLTAIPNCDAYLVKPIDRSLLMFYLKKCGLVTASDIPNAHGG